MMTAAFVLAGIGAVATQPVEAQTFQPGNVNSALGIADAELTTIGGGTEDQIFSTIGYVVNVLLGLLGIVFFVLILYSGFIWMTARGDAAKVAKATTMLTQAVIGIIIILSSYAISNFALAQLLDAAAA